MNNNMDTSFMAVITMSRLFLASVVDTLHKKGYEKEEITDIVREIINKSSQFKNSDAIFEYAKDIEENTGIEINRISV